VEDVDGVDGAAAADSANGANGTEHGGGGGGISGTLMRWCGTSGMTSRPSVTGRASGQRLKMRTFWRIFVTTVESFLARGGGFGGNGFGASRLTGTWTGFLGGSAGGLGCRGIERHATFWSYRLARSRTEPCSDRVRDDGLIAVDSLSLLD